MKNIILVGYMGVGKTTIAQLLSEKTGFKLLDIDKTIENQVQLSINEIFNQKGEIYFRKKEHEVFVNALNQEGNQIVSTGGGTPCYSNNHLLLNGEAVVSVYLKGSVETITKRLKDVQNTRPLIANLSDDELHEFVAKHLFDRSYFYNQATLKVVVDNKSPKQIVEEIIELLH